jgi:hypothetical protein
MLACGNVMEHVRAPTAIESNTSCGRLEPLSAALAAEAERVDAQLTRDTLNEAMPARFDQTRIAIMNFIYFQEADETNEG